MSNAGTLLAGYGVTVGAVVAYAAWLWLRARKLGRDLGIADTADAAGTAGTQP